ncbi:MAG TPA: ABC transporter permease subunit [Desulfobacterales bacterium]|nr:ABC transporter permease subunit [Desulfobacterales bacterium]
MTPLTRVAQWLSILLAVLIFTIILSGLISIRQSAMLQLLQDSEFTRAVIFTLRTSIAATLLTAITAIPAGFYLARHTGPATTIIDTLFDIPIVMPPLVVGVLLLSFFNRPLLKEVCDLIFTTPGAIIAQFFVAVPFTIRAAKNAFELVPPIYEQIAMTLGAGSTKAFFDTTFKLALPAVSAGLVLSWLRCLGEFGATLMVGGGIPGRTENIPIYIYLSMSSGEFKKGMAAAIVAIGAAFCGILLVKLLARRRL